MQLKIKKYIPSSWLIVTLLLGVMCFTACQKDEDNSVRLDAFGPSPALRGGEVRFLGQNLDQVSEIILPTNISVKDITLVSNSEIKITLPQEVVQGLVTLKTKNGDVITTKTELTISEPISITKFYKKGTQNETSVIAGDSIVIEGDYLNFIKEVLFVDNVVVSLNRKEGEVYPRKQLAVAVPITAQTGKIAISNGEEMPIVIYTDASLTVAAASVTSMTPTTIKAGGEITIKGKNLQLVSKVKFQPDLLVEVPAGKDPLAAVSEIKVKVPANIHDGDITLVSYSGLEVKAGTLTMMLPTITSVLPNPVKGGTTLTVKGTNLDLVTNITFPNIKDAVACKTNSGTEITVDVPVDAADGNLVFNTNSGKSVEKAYITVKSTIVNITPISLMAGENITITGTNLDLVRSVIFGGGVSVDITPTSPTSFTLATPATSVSGNITLVLASGAKVTSSQSLTIAPANRPVITAIASSVKPGEKLTITGTKLNLVESITFQNGIKATQYGTRSATSIEVYVPNNAKKGAVTLTMKTYDGVDIVSPTFTISGTDPVADPELVIFDFEDRGGNNAANNAGGWGGIANGKSTATDGVSGSFFEITSANWNAAAYWWIADNWIEAPYPSVSGINNYVLKMDVRLRNNIPAGDAAIRVRIAGNKEVDFLPYLLKNGVYTTGGDWITITIPLSEFSGLADPTPASGDWGIVRGWNNDNINFTGFCVDNIRYERK